MEEIPAYKKLNVIRNTYIKLNLELNDKKT